MTINCNSSKRIGHSNGLIHLNRAQKLSDSRCHHRHVDTSTLVGGVEIRNIIAHGRDHMTSNYEGKTKGGFSTKLASYLATLIGVFPRRKDDYATELAI